MPLGLLGLGPHAFLGEKVFIFKDIASTRKSEAIIICANLADPNELRERNGLKKSFAFMRKRKFWSLTSNRL